MLPQRPNAKNDSDCVGGHRDRLSVSNPSREHFLVSPVEQQILFDFKLLSVAFDCDFVVGVQSHGHEVVLTRRRVPDVHRVAESVPSRSQSGELAERNGVPEEELLREVRGQFNLEHLEPVDSVQVVLADEKPLGKNLLNDHRTLPASLQQLGVLHRQLQSNVDRLTVPPPCHEPLRQGLLPLLNLLHRLRVTVTGRNVCLWHRSVVTGR